jgi:hypothetical protein
MSEGELRLEWKAPGPVAQAFMQESRRPVQGIMGPIGSGKTSAVLMKLVKLAQRQQPSTRDGLRKFKFTVVRDTYRQLWRTTIPTWHAWVPSTIGVWNGATDSPARHTIHMALADGTVCEVIAEFVAIGDNKIEDVLRGYEPTAFYLNEMDLLIEEVLTYCRGRAGRYPRMDEGGPSWFGVLFDLNAPEEDNWTVRVLRDELNEEAIAFFRQPGGMIEVSPGEYIINTKAENLKNLPEGYYENQIEGQPAWYIRRMILSKIGYSRSGKPVYPEFNEDIHVAASELLPVPGLQLKIGADAGRTPAAIIGQSMANGQLRILDELCARDMGPKRFGEALNQLLHSDKYRAWSEPQGELARFGGPVAARITGVGDPSAGFAGDDADERSWLEILSNTTGIYFRPAPTNLITPRLEAVRRPLTRIIDGQHPGILISPTCKVTIKGFNSGYRYRKLQIASREVYDEKPEKNESSHPHDAVQYFALDASDYQEILGRQSSRGAGLQGQTRAIDDECPEGEFGAGGRRRFRSRPTGGEHG